MIRAVPLARVNCAGRDQEKRVTEQILIVEDEPSLQETLAYSLTRQGYNVFAVGDGQAAVSAARRYHPDLILLDIMLPLLDGYEVCRILRREMSVPILMLTARDSEIDRVLGLEMGADDYLTKPFSMREMLARVKAIFRRIQLERDLEPYVRPGPENGPVVSGDLSIDLARGEVARGGHVIQLKPKEFELLLFLVRHHGQMMSRDAILDRVWGWDFSGGSRTVDVHIRWLRMKIEKDPANPERIVTVRGMGYRFEG
jgi:DNA-binding response OmpR family regulator